MAGCGAVHAAQRCHTRAVCPECGIHDVQFRSRFFELQVLPLLFSQSFSQADKVRLLQLDDALRDVDHLAVYYDRGALSQDAEPARLDYGRIDVRRKTGVFHPKLAFILVDEPMESDDEGAGTYQSLVVACLRLI